MAKLEDMNRLLLVMSLRVQNAQTELAEIRAHEASLRHALAQLVPRQAGTGSGQQMTAQAIWQADVEMRWRQWAEVRRAAIQTELANVLSRKEDARKALATAIGKEAALTALIQKTQSRRAGRS